MRPVSLAPLISDDPSLTNGAGSLLSLFLRAGFASILLPFFVASFLTKIDGFGLTIGAYAQILPKQIEAAGYDTSFLALPLHLVVLAGTLAEIVLPLAVTAGFATRLSAVAMIGFIAVMSLTDIYGHGIDAATIGAMFDRDPYGVIADQRLLWVMLLSVVALTGGGKISVDGVIGQWKRRAAWS